MKAELVPENGDPPIPVVRDVTVIGRHESCDVVIDVPGLSKRHCVMVKTDGLLVIRDLATTNGTKVKGQRIRWAALLPEDRISLGGYKIRIYLGSDEMPSPSEQRRARGLASAAPPAVRVAPVKAAANAPTTRMPEDDAGLPRWSGRESALAAPAQTQSPPGGFEIIDDDDDDDIIELDQPPRQFFGSSCSITFGPAARIAPRRRRRRSLTVDLAGVVRLQPAGRAILALDRLVHLLAVYRDFDRGRDPQSYLIASNIHDGDDNIIAYDDTLVAVSGQDQHR